MLTNIRHALAATLAAVVMGALFLGAAAGPALSAGTIV